MNFLRLFFFLFINFVLVWPSYSMEIEAFGLDHQCSEDLLLRIGENNYSILNHYNSFNIEKPISLSSIEQTQFISPSRSRNIDSIWSDSFIIRFNSAILCEQLQSVVHQLKLEDQVLLLNINKTKLSEVFSKEAAKEFLLRNFQSMKEISEIYRHSLLWIYSIKPSSVNDGYFDYSENQFRDVRGYLFLTELKKQSKNENEFKKLLNGDSIISEITEEDLKRSLLQICLNVEKNNLICEQKLEKSKDLHSFYNDYFSLAQANYSGFLRIKNKNSSIQYEYKNGQSNVVFNSEHKIKINNESETGRIFSIIQGFWSSVYSKLIIQDGGPEIIYLPASEYFKKNKSDLFNNEKPEIYVPIEIPKTEYAHKVLLARGFGHLFGFPECSFVAYDNTKDSAYYYEIESDNIMCSDSGSVQPRHLREIFDKYN